MVKTYVVIDENGLIDNVVRWDKDASPVWQCCSNHTTVEQPEITTTITVSGVDIDNSWWPGIGDEYIDNEFIRRNE